MVQRTRPLRDDQVGQLTLTRIFGVPLACARVATGDHGSVRVISFLRCVDDAANIRATRRSVAIIDVGATKVMARISRARAASTVRGATGDGVARPVTFDDERNVFLILSQAHHRH